MMPDTHDDRRAVGRAGIEKGALLFFKGQIGARGCNVIDISNGGARLRTHNLSVLPSKFELTFDNFSTIRWCRLIWRDGDFLGIAFDN
jgi:hypothetical protein